ncbi:DMT family transporter [Halorussus amylolyticus]|uniref:DMT family transporter n=1 Tax=Halorussus amylolyticus TaxID=1126242 RepID=UPI001046A934|nr:DMT family transporter [Halorussus amylolyticus]
MSRYRVVGAFVALAAIWGSTFVVIEAGLAYLPPVLFAALRFDLAAAVLLGYATWRGHRLRPRGRSDWRYLFLGGTLLTGAHYGFLFAGELFVSATVAAVLLGLIPIITPALTRAVGSSERLGAGGVLGALLGFIGVVIIARPSPSNLAGETVVGVGLVLASAVSFAAGAVLLHDSESSLPAASTQGGMMAIAAVFLHAVSAVLPTERGSSAAWTPEMVASVVYLGVVGSVVGYGLYFYLLGEIGPIELSFIEYAIPPFAALTGFLVLGDVVTLPTALGFVAILCGFVAVKYPVLRGEWRRVANR